MVSKAIKRVVNVALWILSGLTALITAVEVYYLGYPSPMVLGTALILTGAIIVWPSVSNSSFHHSLCVECKQIPYGFMEFKFCIHCGSTKAPQRN